MSSQFWSHGKVPIPVERLIRKNDGKAYKDSLLIVGREIKMHLANQPYQFIPGNLFFLGESCLVELFQLPVVGILCSYLYLNQILIILKSRSSERQHACMIG